MRLCIKGVGVLALFLLLFTSPVGAAVSVSYQSDPNQGAYSVSNSDLVNSNSPALLGMTDTGYTPFSWEGGTSTTAALNDGFQGVSYASGNGALGSGAFDLDGIWTTTFYLNGGYNISQIETFASWPEARASQAYTVSIRQVGNLSFTPLTTVDFTVSPDQSSKILIFESGGPLALNVDAIQFDFFVATGPASAKESVYREIDIYGTVVPEPSAIGILLLGGAALLVGRYKKR